jgi:hypothetical protein
MYPFVNLSRPADLSFWAVCLQGFFGFLRKSTLLPSSPVFLVGKILTRGDVVGMCFDSFTLLVRKSKVIQFGQKVLSLPYAKCTDVRLCPVRSILAHFGASPLSLDRPLFNFKRGGKEVFYSQANFVADLKRFLSLAGVNQTLYSAHSLRRGGASYAFEQGVSPMQIKQRGDWASDAFEKYIHMSDKSLLSVAQTLSAGVHA